MSLPARMRAAVLFGPHDVRVIEREVPAPGPEEVLVRVAACGVCGTDVKIINKGIPYMPPYGSFTFGHEWAGTVAAVGKTVDEFRVGDRVAVQAHRGCGRCENCLDGKYTACLNFGRLDKGHRASGMTADGGFAEYALHHAGSVYRLPDSISFNEAVYVTTAGCALYAIDVSGGYIAGDTAVVVGPGPIGLGVVQGARALGAGQVILLGTRAERLALGKQLGATHTINVREVSDPVRAVLELTGGQGAERVYECAGTPAAVDLAVRAAKKSSPIVVVAFYGQPVAIDLDYVSLNQIRLLTVRGEGGRNCQRALSLMAQGKIDARPIVTHTFPLAEINQAVETFVGRAGGALKVVVNP